MNDIVKIIEINSLVISGGGNKGFLFLGVIKLLSQYNILNKIKYFYGTSIGGIIITCIILGWSIEEIINFTIKFPLNKMIDYKYFFSNNGLISKNKYETLLKKIISYKSFDENITLLELFNKNNKELNLFTYNIKNNSTICLNYINTPNIKLVDALYMTTAIPILFPLCNIDNNTYIDGGILDNFPLKFIKEENIHKTIGIYVKSNPLNIQELENLLNSNLFFTNAKKLFNYFNFIINLLKIIINKDNNNNTNNIFKIILNDDIYNTHFLNFSLDTNIKKKMIDNGYKQGFSQFNDIINSLFLFQVKISRQLYYS